MLSEIDTSNTETFNENGNIELVNINRQGPMSWCHMTRTTEPIWRRWASLGTSSPSYWHRKYIIMITMIIIANDVPTII